MTYHDLVLDFWFSGLKLYFVFCALPVIGVAIPIRALLNVVPSAPRATKL